MKKVICLILFTLVVFTSAVPSSCAGLESAVVQDIFDTDTTTEEQESVQAFFGNNFCDPVYTCQYDCSCGPIFFDLRKDQNWNKLKNDFHRACHKVSMKKWLQSTMKNIGKRYKFLKRRAVSYILSEYINKRLSKLKKNCHDKSLIAQIDNALDGIGRLIYKITSFTIGKRFFNKVKKDAKKMFKKLKKNVKRGSFEFCKCETYAKLKTSTRKGFFGIFKKKSRKSSNKTKKNYKKMIHAHCFARCPFDHIKLTHLN